MTVPAPSPAIRYCVSRRFFVPTKMGCFAPLAHLLLQLVLCVAPSDVVQPNNLTFSDWNWLTKQPAVSWAGAGSLIRRYYIS